MGGIVGATVGKAGIAPEWRQQLRDWPRSMHWLEQLAEKLDLAMRSGETNKAPELPFLGQLIRNIGFLIIVLAHVFRRLLPPY